MASRGTGEGRRTGEDLRYTTLKVRLDPTPEQAALFEKTFGCCRWLWNQMLSDQRRFYEETGAFFIPTPARYKGEAPFLREVDSQALIQEHNRLTQAFRVFFRDPEHFGYPNFKRKKDGRDSFTACSHDFASGPTIYTTRDGIRMTKAGIVRARFSRRPQAWWKLRRITVERTPTGKYYCCILYSFQAREGEPVVPTLETTAGLQYSAGHFCVSDTGRRTDAPQWLGQSREKLAELQRRLVRMRPGSRNYRETVQKYRLLHEHIANQRRDFIHKESRRIANAWDAVCVRDAEDAAMAGAGLPDPGFGMFRTCLRYKLERQGKAFITVDRLAPAARTCSACGQVREEVRERTWTCPGCGAVHNREVNAARNVKALGLAQYFRIQERRGSA